MKLRYRKQFQKQFLKLPLAKQAACHKSLKLFEVDPNHALIRNHELKGRWAGHRSISAGGDLRLHYISRDEQIAVFVAVGTHSQLYNN